MKKAVVIGGGFAGLALAALLGKEGYEVTLLEKNSSPGGRARVWRKKGFIFDMGPSWYLAPAVFERFFGLFGRKPNDFYKLVRLNPAYRIFFEDESKVDIFSRLENNMQTFSSFEKGGGRTLAKYLKESKRQYELAFESFIYRDYPNLRSLLKKDILTKGLKFNLFGSFDGFVSKYFSSVKAKQILEYPIVFLGGDPKNTPPLYSMMSHLDFNLGVWYPVGGIGEIVKALVSLGRQNGVKYRFSEKALEIKVKNSKAEGVRTDRGYYPAEVVAVNADYRHAEVDLLGGKLTSYSESYWEKKVIAPSAFIIYLGLSKKLSGLAHHNLVFISDWMKHFRTIFEGQKWPEEYSLYISCPSKTDPTIAPAGGESLFILLPIASGLPDRINIRKKYFREIIKKVEKLTGEKIIENIRVSRIFTINDFKKDYNSYKGSALGLSHTFFQSAFFRPQRKSKKVQNLYFTGGYTHPGIGLPMVLISSELTFKRIIKDDN